MICPAMRAAAPRRPERSNQPLVLNSRCIHIEAGRCSSCDRLVDQRVRCSPPRPTCNTAQCWKCWTRDLDMYCGHVRCVCGSLYGGVMSRFDSDEFQSLWVTKFGYRSWSEAEAANLPPTNPPCSAPPSEEPPVVYDTHENLRWDIG